jgi:hypothetical protein
MQLYNVTTSTVIGIGTTVSSLGSTSWSSLRIILTFTANTTLKIQHRCQSSVSNTGMGGAGGWNTEIYTEMYIEKLA